jgi:membrane-associated phospholipid phosphatase
MPPAISSVRGKYVAAAVTALISALMYFVPQHVRLTDPVYLPMTALEKAIPFWPASGVVYFAVFPLLLGTFLLLRDLGQATRFLYACLFAQTVGMICFLLWPTAYPRELFALPQSTSALGAALVTFCRSMDTPANCLPSLHVSTVVLCVGALRTRRLFVPAVLISIPLALSTLTFKQHYVADVIAGLVLGLLACMIFFRKP